MKRFLLILLLALLAALPALAEDLPVFLLEENGEAAGTAVLFGSENTLLTTAPLASEDQVTLLTDSGSIPVQVYSDPDRMLSLLYSETPLTASPMLLSPVASYNLFSTGFRADGSLSRSACRHAALVSDPSGLTLTAESGLLPGAVISDASGNLCGLVAASLGEGEGRYFALSSTEIYARLFEEDPESAENIEWIDYTASVDGLYVRLDWSDAPEAAEGATYCVYWCDTANTYYTRHTTSSANDSIPCVPGRTYSFYVRKIGSEDGDVAPSSFPDTPETVRIPDAKPVERFGFQDTDVHLAFLAEDQTAGEAEILPELTDFSSVFTHEGFDLYLQVSSTYQVTEESRALLTCALFAPDGSCYPMQGGFIFAPEYMPVDSWHMDVTELFDQCFISTGGRSGTYALRYYLDDELASELTFEIP